jgi:hypothetical protein
MLLVLAAGFGSLVIRPYWPGWSARFEKWKIGRAIEAELNRVVALPPGGTMTLEELLLAVGERTRSDRFPVGVPIYIDPRALSRAKVTMQVVVPVDPRPAPVGVRMREALGSVGLQYVVRDGLVIVGDPES